MGKYFDEAEQRLISLDAQELAKRLLLVTVRELSERHYCAGWMMGLEYALWGMALTGGGGYGQADMSKDMAANLRNLAEIAGGWWAWSEKTENETFIPLEKWKDIYHAKMENK